MCPSGRPSRALLDYHRAVAAGAGDDDCGLRGRGAERLSFAHQLWLRPEVTSDLRALTDAVHAEGAAASIQIGHCGNMAKRSVAGGRALAPSARFNLYGPTWPRAMTKGDIERVATSFGRAVSLARESGFDAVEVHAGHGYLLSQFLSPSTNHRRDEYGGSLENRLRFLRLAMSRVRDAARGDVAVLVKTNLRDGFPGGIELEEGLLVARALEEAGADALVLSGGFVSRAPMFILRGRSTRVMGRLMGESGDAGRSVLVRAMARSARGVPGELLSEDVRGAARGQVAARLRGARPCRAPGSTTCSRAGSRLSRWRGRSSWIRGS